MIGKMFPIRLNQAGFPPFLQAFLPDYFIPMGIARGKIDARWFTRFVSSLRDKTGIWKTTCSLRHDQSDQALASLVPFSDQTTILDIGVSDGSTSLSLIRRLGVNFRSFIVSDRTLFLKIRRRKGRIYFFHQGDPSCFLWASRCFIVYLSGPAASPFQAFLASLFAPNPAEPDEGRQLSLLQPALVAEARNDSRIVFREHDIFQPWTGPTPDVVKVANLLNLSYFPVPAIRAARNRLFQTLAANGYLLLVENRHQEQWSLFQKRGSRFFAVQSGNGGSDIQDLMQEPNLEDEQRGRGQSS